MEILRNKLYFQIGINKNKKEIQLLFNYSSYFFFVVSFRGFLAGYGDITKSLETLFGA
jgi:hypothetical protein